jgi:DNA topoisomerase VI subunit A
VDKITNGVSDVIKKSFIVPENSHLREFYYYEYEHWNLLEGWCKDKQKLSDESFECIASTTPTAPEGWVWST